MRTPTTDDETDDTNTDTDFHTQPMIEQFLTIQDHLELHDRDEDRKSARSGQVFYVNNGQVHKVNDAGTIEKPLAIEKGTGTSSASASLGSGWTTADANRPVWIEVDARAETDGGSAGKVAIEVDEDGGTTADYSMTVAQVAPDNAAGTSQEASTKVYVPAGAQYRITNTDPNNGNSVSNTRKVVA